MNPGAALARAVGGKARLRIMAMLAAVLALSSADTATIGAIAGPLERGLHVGNTSIGLLVTLSTAVSALVTLPMGELADRVNRTRLLDAAVLIWSVVMVINGLSVSFTMLLVSRLALGVVMAVGGPVIASLTGDWFPVSERARIYGFVLSGELVGAGIGFVLSGDLADALSWRWAFWTLAAIGLALSWLVRRAPEPARGGASRLPVGATDFTAGQDDTAGPGTRPSGPSEHPATEPSDDDPLVEALRAEHVEPYDRHGPRLGEHPSMWRTLRVILSIRSVVALIIASSLGYFFFTGVETFGVLFLQKRFGIREAVASSLLVLVGAGAIVGSLSSGRFADRLLKRGYVPARPVTAGLAFLICAALFVPALLLTSVLVAAPLIALAAAGLGATNPPLDAARLDLINEKMWGRAEAVRTVLRSSFQAIAPLLFGVLSTTFGERTSGLGNPTSTSNGDHGVGLDHTFLVMLAPMVAAGVLLLVVVRRTYPHDVAAAVRSQLHDQHPGTRETSAGAAS